jgi:hypothetical protein
MRPKSYCDTPPSNRCGNCKHAHLIAGPLHLLCFRGDSIEVTGHSGYPVTAEYVELDGVDMSTLLECGEYDKIWADRAVDSDAFCDEWEVE